jgi:DNA repair protein RadC
MTKKDLLTLNEIEVSYKPNFKLSERPRITQAVDIVAMLRSIWNNDKLEYLEESYAIYVNMGNRVVGAMFLSRGGTTSCVIDPRILFGTALKIGASGIIIAHNHPSGTLKPSINDIEITDKLKRGGDLLKIKLLDHIIITREGYYSFMEEGAL